MINADFVRIDEAEFERLVGDRRGSMKGVLFDEIDWLATRDRTVVGLVLRDRKEDDYGWVCFVCRADGYVTVDGECSLASPRLAFQAVMDRMAQEAV